MSAFILFQFGIFYKTVVVVQYSSTSATSTSLLFIFFSETNRNCGATERATTNKTQNIESETTSKCIKDIESYAISKTNYPPKLQH